jgi:tetratricopeptide (TPR) repeat protein
LLLFVGGLSLCVALWLRSSTQDSHQLMLNLLEEVQARTQVENHFLGDADYRQATDKLSEATAFSDQISTLWSRAPMALRLGRTDEALADYQRVQSMMLQAGRSLGEAQIQEFEVELHYAMAIAYMRKGETENCVHCRTGESCILPIRGTGVHKQQEGSQKAIEHLQVVLDRQPDHLSARWLLNLAHMTLGTFPDQVPSQFLISPQSFESEVSFPRFNNSLRMLVVDGLLTLRNGLASMTAVFPRACLGEIMITIVTPTCMFPIWVRPIDCFTTIVTVRFEMWPRS